MAAEQIELRLAVPVCAWCKRKANPCSADAAETSHGICPRHLKMLRAEMLVLKGEVAPAHKSVVRRLRRSEPAPEELLPMVEEIGKSPARTRALVSV